MRFIQVVAVVVLVGCGFCAWGQTVPAATSPPPAVNELPPRTPAAGPAVPGPARVAPPLAGAMPFYGKPLPLPSGAMYPAPGFWPGSPPVPYPATPANANSYGMSPAFRIPRPPRNSILSLGIFRPRRPPTSISGRHGSFRSTAVGQIFFPCLTRPGTAPVSTPRRRPCWLPAPR